jgi:flagellar motor switch protein FliN/FliY
MDKVKEEKIGDPETKNGLDSIGVRKAEGSSLVNGKDISNLDFILDIPLEVSVELGRAKMLISDLLQLGQGSVIELTKLAGEPLEIFVNQKLIARGEVVVVNEKFGIRMTDIISPSERVKQLGS